jgi:hypothetical protein
MLLVKAIYMIPVVVPKLTYINPLNISLNSMRN